ncbi:MAG: MFS transporter [Campylobacterota bacterium]|nr:MFS transporter [Campylobacterota bacterium]
MAFLFSSFYFFYFAIIAIHIIFIPKVLDMVGFSPSEIGIIFASAPLVRFIIPFLFLKGLQLGRNIFNQALLLLFISALSFYPALYSFWGLLLANIGLGIGLSLILPYIEVIALEQIGKERYGKIRLFGSIGFILVALVLVKTLSFPEVAIYYLVGAVLLTALFGYSIASQELHHTSSSEHNTDSALNIFAHPWLWLGFLLMQVSFGPFYNFFTIYETDHGISLDMTIYLWSFGVIIEVLMFYFQGPLLRRNLLHVIQFTALATALRWFLVYLYPENLSVLFFTQSLHALSFALFHTAAISYLFSLYQDKKLTQQFFFGIAYGLGGFIGAFTSGYIYEFWPEFLFLFAALMSLMTFGAFLKASKYQTLRNQN